MEPFGHFKRDDGYIVVMCRIACMGQECAGQTVLYLIRFQAGTRA